MAFGGRELRLFLSIQSYGTTNISRLRRDLAGLQTMTEALNARNLAQARLAQRQARVAGAEQQLKTVRSGATVYAARNKAATALWRAESGVLQTQAAQQLAVKKLFDIETQREGLRRKIAAARVAGAGKYEIEFLERGFTSLNMAQAATTLNQKALTESLAAQQTVVAQLDREYRQLVATKGAHAAASQAAKANLDAETAALKAQEIAAAQAALAVKLLPLERLEQSARRIAHMGRAAQFAGLLITAGFSMAGTAAANFSEKLYLAATQARDIDAPVSQTITRVGELEKGIDRAGRHIDGILDLMQQFPATGEEMADSAYNIYSSMDVSFGRGLKLLKYFNQVAVATGGDLANATDAGITVLNNFGKSSENVNKTLNLMVTTIRYGRMHLAEFNAMLEKVAPAASAAGQSFEDVAGAMALITTRQPSQRVGATGIARLLQTFQDPDFQRGVYNITDSFVDMTKGAGAVGALKPLPIIINDLAGAFGKFSRFGGPQQLFKELTAVGRGRGVGRQSRIEAWRAYTFLVGNLEDYNELQRKTTTNTTEFAKALEAMSQAPGVRWKIFLNQMRAFVIIIGEAALPALLWMAAGLGRLAKWFQGLDEGMRKLVITIGVFTGAFLLFGGTLVNIGGSIAAFIFQMKILATIKTATTAMELAGLGTAAATSASKMAMLLTAARMLAGVGVIAIPIGIQLFRGGDPGLWTLLSAAGFGAIGGAMIGGLPGAAIGALTVPIAVNFVAEMQERRDPVMSAYEDYLKDQMPVWKRRLYQAGGILELAGIVDLKAKQGPEFKAWLKEHPKYLKIWREQQKDHTQSSEDIWKRYRKMVGKEQKALVKEMLGYGKDLNTAWKKQDQVHSEAAQEAAQRAEDAVRDAAEITRTRTEAMATAHENMVAKIKSAVDNLLNIYNQFLQANEQAFGEIAQGPVMSGMFGQIFEEINNTMRQFGVQIAVPFNILQQDLDMQVDYFTRWRNDLQKLGKRGVPLEFLQELQALGPEKGIPIIEGLLGATPKQFRRYVNQWKAGQKLIKAATKKDMDDQLEDWERHGKNIALAIIQGLISEPAQAALKKGFREYVVGTFGEILRKSMSKEVAKAVADAIKSQEFQNAIDKAATAAGKAAAAKVTAAAAAAEEGKPGKTVTAARPVGKLDIAGLRAEQRRIDRQQAAIAREVQRTDDRAERWAGPTPAQQQQLDRLARRERNVQRAYQAWLANERRAVKRQLGEQRRIAKLSGGVKTTYTITYEGDTVTVRADGATVQSVMRALNKKKFQQKSRHPKKQPQRRGA